jgi:hypothetical protein
MGFSSLGRTERILRLPSLVGGTAALWFTFAWIRRSLGEIPALAGLGFMALSPAAISASTEVRQYGLLLCFVCGSLYATERTFIERSTIWAIVQGLFLLGALLTHYTAVLVLLSLGLYVLLRSLLDGVPRRILFTIGASQLVLATLLGWLYFGHVRGSIPFGSGASMDYLQPYYYAEARETPLRRLAFLFMLAFLAGLAALLGGRTKARRLMALLVISPFAGVRGCLSGFPLCRFPAPDVSAALPRGGYFGRARLPARQAGGASTTARSRYRAILGYPHRVRQ